MLIVPPDFGFSGFSVNADTGGAAGAALGAGVGEGEGEGVGAGAVVGAGDGVGEAGAFGSQEASSISATVRTLMTNKSVLFFMGLSSLISLMENRANE